MTKNRQGKPIRTTFTDKKDLVTIIDVRPGEPTRTYYLEVGALVENGDSNVTSFNGRSGNITATNTDYSASLIATSTGPTGFVEGALTEIDGILPLKADLVAGKVPLSQLPGLELSDSFVVADIAGRDALTIGVNTGEVSVGDIVIVGDASADPGIVSGGATYVWSGSSFLRLLWPDTVISVNGQDGIVTLTASNLAATGFTGSTVQASLSELQASIIAHAALTNNPHAVTKAQVGLGNVPNIDTSNSDNITEGSVNKFVTPAQETALSSLAADLSGKVDTTALGVSVATLTSGVLTASQVPSYLLGGVTYVGTWNAATNTPTLAAPSITNKGHYYITTTAGIYNTVSYAAGDWIISNGVTWDQVANTDEVNSVNGQVGVVTIDAADVNLVSTTGFTATTVEGALHELQANSGNVSVRTMAVSGNFTVDWSLAPVVIVDLSGLTGTASCTFTNPTELSFYTLVFENNTNREVTFQASVVDSRDGLAYDGFIASFEGQTMNILFKDSLYYVNQY